MKIEYSGLTLNILSSHTYSLQWPYWISLVYCKNSNLFLSHTIGSLVLLSLRLTSWMRTFLLILIFWLLYFGTVSEMATCLWTWLGLKYPKSSHPDVGSENRTAMSSDFGNFSVKMMIFLFPDTGALFSQISRIFRFSACLLKIGLEQIGPTAVVKLDFPL